MIGWIKINREIINHWCSNDPSFFAVWIRLLSEANFKTKKTMVNRSPVTIKRGQLIFGLNAFSQKSGVTVSKLRKIIKVLLKEGMIDRQKTNKYSIISITNYEKYQVVDKQTTSRRQADDKQTTTLEEGKEGKELKNGKWQFFLRICVLAGIDPERNARATKQSQVILQRWLDVGLAEQTIIETIDTVLKNNRKNDPDLSPNTLKYFDAIMDEEIKVTCENNGEWIERMGLHKKGKWLKSWGPPPTDPDTNVPKNIINQFNKG